MSTEEDHQDYKDSKVIVADEETGPNVRRGSVIIIKELVEEDHSHDIKLRTMTWQRASWLLAGDQVCLAIMAQTW